MGARGAGAGVVDRGIAQGRVARVAATLPVPPVQPRAAPTMPFVLPVPAPTPLPAAIPLRIDPAPRPVERPVDRSTGPARRWIQCAGVTRDVRAGLVECPRRGTLTARACLDCHLLETLAVERDPATSCSVPLPVSARW